ncbi:MAG: hypothetical protein IT376_11195 [Polyangiaceae bacterium]|nr:hypothetical protein [Polyangiaceae bacterium]
MKNGARIVLVGALLGVGASACAWEVGADDSEAVSAQSSQELHGLTPIQAVPEELETPTGPTPDPWRASEAGGTVSKPTPDPWRDPAPSKEPGVRGEGTGANAEQER